MRNSTYNMKTLKNREIEQIQYWVGGAGYGEEGVRGE
jgi:hypothetical protein